MQLRTSSIIDIRDGGDTGKGRGRIYFSLPTFCVGCSGLAHNKKNEWNYCTCFLRKTPAEQVERHPSDRRYIRVRDRPAELAWWLFEAKRTKLLYSMYCAAERLMICEIRFKVSIILYAHTTHTMTTGTSSLISIFFLNPG